MGFPLSQIEANARDAELVARWFVLSGTVFGDGCRLPLKLHITAGGQAWYDGWTRGLREYKRGLPALERRRFDLAAAGRTSTIPHPAMAAANRAAARRSGAILAVAPVCPVVVDPDVPLEPAIAQTFQMPSLAPELRALYRQRPADGLWELPLEVAPTPDLIATRGQVERLLGDDDFAVQVGRCHAELVSRRRTP